MSWEPFQDPKDKRLATLERELAEARKLQIKTERHAGSLFLERENLKHERDAFQRQNAELVGAVRHYFKCCKPPATWDDFDKAEAELLDKIDRAMREGASPVS